MENLVKTWHISLLFLFSIHSSGVAQHNPLQFEPLAVPQSLSQIPYPIFIDLISHYRKLPKLRRLLKPVMNNYLKLILTQTLQLWLSYLLPEAAQE